LILWGQNDIFFTKEGGEAYLKDVPNDEIHRPDSGHFAIEDCFDEIADSIQHFYFEKVAGVPD
jgi:pimeloyl-ACP methyl ester carboxylesterase